MYTINEIRSPLLLMLLSVLTAHTVVAGTMGPIVRTNPWSAYVITLSAGPVWTNGGKTQTLALQPDIVKTYTMNNKTSILSEEELFFGLQPSINACLDGQLGIALAMTGNAAFAGNIWDEANPAFNNFNYTYNVSHKHIAVKGKLLGQWNTPYFDQPYISASLGVGSNTSRDFNATPTIPEAEPSPAFTSNSTTSFTYTVGIGVQSTLSYHWLLGVGYEFSDWGQSHLGPAAGQTTSHGLSLNHLYTNGLMINLTYLA